MQGQLLAGHYQITQLLGRGGFGITYLAKDLQRPGQPDCVVKQFKPVAGDPYTLQAGKKLFDQEAEILEVLGNHDKIPRLLAYFEENQEFYLVQEYISGYDLKAELTPEQPKDEKYIVNFLQEILSILTFVHDKGVIHRDIKPSNIRRRHGDNCIVLIDFGAVKQVSTQIANAQGQTTLTSAIGSPGYMPNEQMKGKPKPCSDIYAVGVICIQVITGINPDPRFGDGLPTDAITGEIVWRNQSVVKISAQLADIIDKMVCEREGQRYQSAKEVLQDLYQISSTIAAAPVISTSPTQITPKRQFPIRKIIGAGLVAMAGLVGSVIIAPMLLTASIKLVPYPDSEYGFTINRPENWEIRKIESAFIGDVVQFISPPRSGDNFPEAVTISIEKFSGTFDEYAQAEVQDVRFHVKSVKDIQTQITTLGQRKASELTYVGEENAKATKYWKIWVLQGEKVYTITYAADVNDFNRYFPIVKKMVGTFAMDSKPITN